MSLHVVGVPWPARVSRANFACMTDTPNSEPPASIAEPVVDTSPAAPERTAVTWGILLLVLAALIAFFVQRIAGAR